MLKLLAILGLPKKLLVDPEHQFIQQLRGQIHQLELQNWLHDDLHKWTWYLNLLLTLLPIYIIWKVIDRRRLLELMTFGLFLAVVITLLDSLGLVLNLWDYPDSLLPIEPRLFPINLVGLPVFYMLAYQYFQSWSRFVVASLALAALFAFAGEPLFIWLNLYDPIHWHPLFSLPIYFVLPLFGRLVTSRLVKYDLPYSKGK